MSGGRRAWVLNRIKPTLVAGPTKGRVYPRGSLGIGTNPAEPEVPYVMFAFGNADSNEEVRDNHQSVTDTLCIYVYDRKGSYVRIDEIHKAVRETLEVLSGYGDDDWRCTDIVFTGLDAETTDGSNNLRIGSYRLTGKQ